MACRIFLGSPPTLSGVLDPQKNNWLTKAKQYAHNLVSGPESLVVVDDYVYTGLSDGWVVEIKPVMPNGRIRRILRMSTRACSTSASEETCGRPLGIRMDSKGYLIVVDPYKGIYKINPFTGRFEQLVDAKMKVNEKPLGFISDLSIASDDTIFFSSSSSKWNHAEQLNILLEGEKSGRVLVYNPHERDPQKKVQELVTKLSFPDGLQLSKDQSYLLVAERARARIFKVHVGNTPQRGTIEVFAFNLPGFVDNIRLSPRGTYWVGLSHVRHKARPSLLDTFGNLPNKRREFMARPPKEVERSEFPEHGMALELDDHGHILRSLQDPTGKVFKSVSEVQEVGNYLFMVSPNSDFIGLLKLSDIPSALPQLPPATEPPVTTTPTTTTINTTTAMTTPRPTSTRPPATDLLSKVLAMVSQRLKGLNSSAVREVLVKLVFMLIEATVETRRAADRLVRVENELLQLRAHFNRGLLTQYQKQLIRTSWEAYNRGPGVLEDSVVIFVRLFNETPDAVPLFSSVAANGVRQESLENNTRFMTLVAKVVGSLTTVVSNLDSPGVLATLVRQMGARHAGYGVQLKHFPPFKTGIFEALEKRLGASFTPESRHAWDSLLDLLFSYMKQGMNTAKRK